jgi:hypothetical protein
MSKKITRLFFQRDNDWLLHKNLTKKSKINLENIKILSVYLYRTKKQNNV